MTMRSTHNDLIAWQEAMNLVECVYRDSEAFPPNETFGLTAQIRDEAVSLPFNLCESAASTSGEELMQFVAVSCGALAELQTQLQLAVRLGFLSSDSPSLAQADRVGKLV